MAEGLVNTAIKPFSGIISSNSFTISWQTTFTSLAKDRETLENVEQKSSKPYRQLALKGSG